MSGKQRYKTEEKERTADFKSVQPGDNVWSVIYGWGEVVYVGPVSFKVKFALGLINCVTAYYTMDGFPNSRTYGLPELLWNELPTTDIALTPPKRKTTKWFFLHTSGMRSTEFYESKDSCLRDMMNYSGSQGPFPFKTEE